MLKSFNMKGYSSCNDDDDDEESFVFTCKMYLSNFSLLKSDKIFIYSINLQT